MIRLKYFTPRVRSYEKPPGNPIRVTGRIIITILDAIEKVQYYSYKSLSRAFFIFAVALFWVATTCTAS